MIKHRFIIRGADDFKIFAAIPCEKQVLTWKKWVRPPDWEGLDELERYTCDALLKAVPLFVRCAESSERIASLSPAELPSTLPKESIEDSAWRGPFARQVAENFIKAVDLIRGYAALRVQHRAEGTLERAEFDADADSLLRTVNEKGIRQFINVRSTAAENLREWGALPLHRARAEYRELLQTHVRLYSAMVEISDVMSELRAYTIARTDEFRSTEPFSATPCPAGTPFAAYSIEFQGSIFSIVEGCAWVSARPQSRRPVVPAAAAPLEVDLEKLRNRLFAEGVPVEKIRAGMDVDVDRASGELCNWSATDEEKRVVEIITQMLVERGLNPKAETRIPVVEADARDAHHVREAERRDTQANRAPKVRTIKFHVTPPRYLREAAERIFAAPGKPRKAHWVIGHWRQQACGVGHKDHREKWIKPHIRGLGEAGAVVARVAASDEEVAAQR